MSDPRAKRGVEIQDAIRQILYHEWDPIGVSGWGPDDEYDSYIGPIYRILVGSRSKQEIIDFLHETERTTIGMPYERPEQLQKIAYKLLQIDATM